MKTFKYLLFVGPLLAILAGCGDIPYSDGSNPVQPPSPPGEPPPSPGEPGPPPKTVFASVSGVVDIGNPVFGARVSVHDFKNATQGRELGSSTTDANGNYKIDILERLEGPCLLVSEGGEYVEPSTQQRTLMTATQVLSAPITGLKVENEIAINAWTTWAAARTKASRSLVGTDKIAILENLSLMSKHLKKDVEDEAILNVKAVNLFINGVNPNDFNVLLQLSQQGLSALAEDTYRISMAQLISVLADDLADGVFDDSEATRSKLVLKIDEVIQKTNKVKKFGFNQEAFRSQSIFFETLSLDSNKLLYHEGDVPTHPADVLKLPVLYKLLVQQAAKLKPLDLIEMSAEVRSPQDMARIDASLIELKRTVTCISDFESELLATGFSIGKLKSCQLSKVVETVIETKESLQIRNGRINATFQGQPGDLKQEIGYKVSVMAKHKGGNERTFATEAFSPIPDAAPSSKKEELFNKAISQNNTDVALEFITQGVNVTAQTKTGEIPLKSAILAENAKILRGLVWAGVDLNSKDDSGRTALDCARFFGKQTALKSMQDMLSAKRENFIDKGTMGYPEDDLNKSNLCGSMQLQAFVEQCINKPELEEMQRINAAPVCSNGNFFHAVFCKKRVD